MLQIFLVLRVGVHVVNCLEDLSPHGPSYFQTSARKGVEQSEGIQFILVSCVSVSIWIIGMELHSTLASIVGVIIFPYRLGVLPYQFMVFLFGVLPTECQIFLCMLCYGCIMLSCFIHSDSPVGCDGILSYL